MGECCRDYSATNAQVGGSNPPAPATWARSSVVEQVHVSTILVGGTGLVYAWMLYVLEPVDEFSVVHHAWQPQTQHAHVWLAPVMVFAIGLIWRNHVWRHYRGGRTNTRPV